jgi:DNA polymerase-3 subunit beta
VKLRIERDVLAEAVAWTARSLPTRPSQPVLAGLVLTATGDSLVLSAYDHEVSARAEVEAAVETEGTVVVSGRLLSDITRNLPAAVVTLALTGSRVDVTCGRASYTVPTMSINEYPVLPQMPTVTGSLPTTVFAQAVQQVQIAAGRDDSLPAFTGIRIEISGDTITMAATDRYRLAVREFAWHPETPGFEAQALVPARTLSDVAKGMASGESVSLALTNGGAGEGLMGFECAGRRTTTRLLDGDFPGFRKLLPQEPTSVIYVDTEELLGAVNRVALVAEKNQPVRINVTAHEIELSAGGDEAHATELLDGVLEGEPIEISFNPQFLAEGLGALRAPVTRIACTTPGKPAIFTGVAERGAPANVEYQYLLMPVRLAG